MPSESASKIYQSDTILKFTSVSTEARVSYLVDALHFPFEVLRFRRKRRSVVFRKASTDSFLPQKYHLSTNYQ